MVSFYCLSLATFIEKLKSKNVKDAIHFLGVAWLGPSHSCIAKGFLKLNLSEEKNEENEVIADARQKSIDF